MKTAYFGISKSNRSHFDAEIKVLKNVLSQNNIHLKVFVDNYNFKPHQGKEMMEIAFREIDESDLVIVELSKKAIGVGVEVGYAFAKGKPIIYIKKEEAKYSTTVGGSADFLIEYKNELELKIGIEKILRTNLKQQKI